VTDADLHALQTVRRQLDSLVSRRILCGLSEFDVRAYERLGVEEARLLNGDG
jgi:hypothetical protein